MKKILIILTALLVLSCASQPQLKVPKHIEYNKKNYYLASSQDLGTIARYFYVAKNNSIESWQSAVELLFDRNNEQRSLSDRIILRKSVYKKNGIRHFNLYSKNNELYSFVIYEPTKINPHWQVDISKGKDFPFCGFVQYQYSFKLMKTPISTMNKTKIVQHLKKYIVDKEMDHISNIQLMSCQK